ncbi:MAG: pentapeptide repeat-containing protein [Cyanobacteria bacterium J06581_3]
MNPIKSSFRWLSSGLSGKSAWEWLELLIVPLGLAIGAFYLEDRVENRQERIATERYEQERSIADERAKQGVLDSYLDKMQGLLLDRGLRESAEGSEVRSVARAITTTAMKELGSERNALLINFLQESNLIAEDESFERGKDKNIFLLSRLNLSDTDLKNADLKNADLPRVNLRDADLRETNLGGANLIRTNLSGADLREASLSGADLSDIDLIKTFIGSADLPRANLRGANLRGANLSSADLNNIDLSDIDLSEADLGSVNLSEADLRGTDLSNAYLGGARRSEIGLSGMGVFWPAADLSGTDLSEADLGSANLRETNLSGADLSEAKNVTKEQLSEAKLCNTKLPKGIDLDPNRDCP